MRVNRRCCQEISCLLCKAYWYVLKSIFQPHSFSLLAVLWPHSYLTTGSISPWAMKMGVSLFGFSSGTISRILFWSRR